MRSIAITLLAAGLLCSGCAAPVGTGAGDSIHGPLGKADGHDVPRAPLVFCEDDVQELVRAHAEGWWSDEVDPEEGSEQFAALYEDLASRGLTTRSGPTQHFTWLPQESGDAWSLTIVHGGNLAVFVLAEEGADVPEEAATAEGFVTLEVEQVAFFESSEEEEPMIGHCDDTWIIELPEAAIPATGAVDVAVPVHVEMVEVVGQAELDLDLVWNVPADGKKSASGPKVSLVRGDVEVILFDGTVSGAEGSHHLNRTFDLTEAFHGTAGQGEWTLRIVVPTTDGSRSAELRDARLRLVDIVEPEPAEEATPETIET